MSEKLPNFVDDVISTCKVGVEEAAAALVRAIDGELMMSLGSQSSLQEAAEQLDLQGPGLIVLLKTARTTVVMSIPAAKGLLPAWCAQPDLTGEAKLATLAQELGMSLLPESWLPNDFRAQWVNNLAKALERGGVPADAVVVALAVSQAGQPKGAIGLFLPVSNPYDLFAAGPWDAQEEPDLIGQSDLIGQAKHVETPTLPLSSGDLPPYTRSLLRIKVPVVVTLAEKRQKLSRIIELGPGSIIQFDKSCEEMLDLEVGNRPVASGEAVKVGDKFGLRIIAMVLPEERFSPVNPQDVKTRV